jgi:hypothetical protein
VKNAPLPEEGETEEQETERDEVGIGGVKGHVDIRLSCPKKLLVRQEVSREALARIRPRLSLVHGSEYRARLTHHQTRGA